MRVEQLMTSPAQWCRPGDSLEHAAQLMWDHDCGCIAVCDGDGIARTTGVVTDRDICMCALFRGRPLRDLQVSDAMAHVLIACQPDDSLDTAEKTMREAHIRRLPVLDDDGALMGIISLADLAREAAFERTKSRQEVTDREVSSTLAAICEPSRPPPVPPPF